MYTCPMHPEIEQDHPGHCPKCGMTLEPKTIGAGDEEEQKEIRSLSRKFWSALVLTIPVLFIAMGHAIPGLQNSLVVTKILERARPHDSGAVYRDGSRNSGTGRGRDNPETNLEMDRICPCNPGSPLGGRLFLHPRLAVDC